jgi:hypothetical protein
VVINREIVADVNGDLSETLYFTFPSLIFGILDIETDTSVARYMPAPRAG